MKSKLHTTKKTAVVLLGAGAIAITGIAFGSWVISETKGGTTPSQITIQAADVIDESLVVQNISFLNEDSSVRFDAKSDDSSGPIAYGTEEGGGEDMGFAFKFDIVGAVENGSGSYAFTDYFGGFTLTMSVTDQEGYTLSQAVSSNYIVSPIDLEDGTTIEKTPINLVSGTATYTDSSTGSTYNFSCGNGDTLTVTCNLNFAWGTAFANGNPAEFVNEATASDSLSSVKTALENIQKINNSSFTITITPNKSGSN